MSFIQPEPVIEIQEDIPQPSKRYRIEANREQVIERLLLLMFVFVATLSVLWHLGTSLAWVWTSCASELHSAITLAGVS